MSKSLPLSNHLSDIFNYQSRDIYLFDFIVMIWHHHQIKIFAYPLTIYSRKVLSILNIDLIDKRREYRVVFGYEQYCNIEALDRFTCIHEPLLDRYLLCDSRELVCNKFHRLSNILIEALLWDCINQDVPSVWVDQLVLIERFGH